MVTICTASLTFNNSTFCPHSVFMCFVWISEQTAIISLYNINWLVFRTETECVYCAVRTECLYAIRLNPIIAGLSRFSAQSTHDVHTVQTGPAGSLNEPWKVKQAHGHYKCKQVACNRHYNVHSYTGAQFTAPHSCITNHFPLNRTVPFKSVTLSYTADTEGILPAVLIEVSSWPLSYFRPAEMWWHTRRNHISSFARNGPVHLNRRGRQFSRLLAAELSESAVVMLDTPCSEVVWKVLSTHCIRQFSLNFPSRASPCAITFQPKVTRVITWSPIESWQADKLRGRSGGRGRVIEGDVWRSTHETSLRSLSIITGKLILVFTATWEWRAS